MRSFLRLSQLNMRHVRDAAHGCPVPSLAAEVARASEEVKSAFETGIVDLKNVLTGLTGLSSAAWTLMAQNVGAVMIARTTLHDSAKKEILSAVRMAGVALLTDTKVPAP